MKTDRVVVWHRVIDLQAHTDALLVPRLVVRAFNIVVKLCLIREQVRFVKGNEEGSCCLKLNFSQRYVELPNRICQITLISNDSYKRR